MSMLLFPERGCSIMTDIFFDGLCEPGNPGGHACYGFVILIDGESAFDGHGHLGYGEIKTSVGLRKTTNNMAEYGALIKALGCVWEKNIADDHLRIKGDSKLVVEQVSGNWACHKDHLRAAKNKVESLLEGVCFEIKWIPRDENEVADAMSRQAYWEVTGKQPPIRGKQ